MEIERIAVSVNEARRAIGLSRTSMYQAIRTGRIPSIRIGRRILIPVSSLAHLLDQAGAETIPDEAAEKNASS